MTTTENTLTRINPTWLTAAATTACAVAGAAASDPDTIYYRTLNTPSWNPPNAAFPIAWTTLYTDITLTTGSTLTRLREEDPREAGRYAAALAANLVLNAGWSYVFFRAKKTGLSAIWAGALAASSADLARRTARVNTTAGLALSPYAAWTAFATALSTDIWRRNR